MPQYPPSASVGSPSSASALVAESLGYEAVAASQTKQVLGATGAVGDTLERLVIVPALAAAGAVTLYDGNTAVLSFPGGGTTALPSLAPISIPLGIKSLNGAWSVTTGASVAAIGIGVFS